MVWQDYDDVNTQNAYNKGFQSYLKGYHKTDNPYAPGSKSFDSWNEGWWKAYEQSLTEWRIE